MLLRRRGQQSLRVRAQRAESEPRWERVRRSVEVN